MSLLSDDRELFRPRPMRRRISGPDESGLFSFSGSVGPNGDNRRDDVIKAQILLGNSGDYDLASLGAPTGWPGGELYRGIRRYQNRKGAAADGLLLPLKPGGVDANGVGETLAALQSDLGDTLSDYGVPTPDQVDAHYRAWSRDRDGDGGATSAPFSKIIVASENGTAPHPLGLIPPYSRHAATPPGNVQSDIPDAAPPQAKPGQQTAFLPAAAPAAVAVTRAAPALFNLLRGVIGTATGGAAAALSGDTAEQPSHAPDHDQARTPDPAQPEIEAPDDNAPAQPPLPKGRIVIAEDGGELHVPQLEPWADELESDDREMAEEFNDALAIEMAKHGGGRGNLLTQRDVNIAIQECIEAAKKEFPDAEIRHMYGGNRNGKPDGDRLKEEHLWEYDKEGKKVRLGSRRPDWGIVVARNIVEMARGNTVDIKRSGESSTREAEAEQGIREKTEGEKMTVVAKAKAPMTAEEFRANVRKVCTDTMKELHMDWTRRGEFEKPAPKQPGDYAGPASARTAAERRRLLGK